MVTRIDSSLYLIELNVGNKTSQLASCISVDLMRSTGIAESCLIMMKILQLELFMCNPPFSQYNSKIWMNVFHQTLSITILLNPCIFAHTITDACG